MPIREKKHRLPEIAYAGKRTISFTACVEDRKPLFLERQVVEPFVDILRSNVEIHRCYVPIYCFMPDHLHVMIAGLEDQSNGKAAMEGFKMASALWLSENRPDYRWQKDFHDRVIRRSEDWRQHALYIYRNPIRAGLTPNPLEFYGTGSIGADLVELVTDLR